MHQAVDRTDFCPPLADLTDGRSAASLGAAATGLRLEREILGRQLATRRELVARPPHRAERDFPVGETALLLALERRRLGRRSGSGCAAWLCTLRRTSRPRRWILRSRLLHCVGQLLVATGKCAFAAAIVEQGRLKSCFSVPAGQIWR